MGATLRTDYRFFFFLRRALKQMQDKPLASAASIALLSLWLFFTGAVVVLLKITHPLFPLWMRSSSVAVAYLHAHTATADQERLSEELRTWPEVLEVRSVSAEEARAGLMNRLGEWSTLLAGMDETFLPPSLEIRVRANENPGESLEKILDRIRQYPQVEEVFYGKNWAEKLEFVSKVMNFAGMVISGCLGVIAVMVIFHTIKLSFVVQREELELYLLFGATPLFVKAPFYLEGLIYGICSAALVGGFFMGLHALALHNLPLTVITALSGRSWEWGSMMAGLLAAGLGLGYLGSCLALRHVLKTIGNQG